MHFGFIPYGKRSCVELLLREMEAQKHYLPMWKGKKKKKIWMQAQVRILPGGVIEYVFPKEDMDRVLATMVKSDKLPYGLSEKWIFLARKMLKFDKIPKFNNKENYVWIKDYVSIIPLGIREDGEIVGIKELDRGWTHEAI